VDRLLDLTGVANGLDSDLNDHKSQATEPAKKLLDIGSGWGYLVKRASERGLQATGLCNCASMVQCASERYVSMWLSLYSYRCVSLYFCLLCSYSHVFTYSCICI